jgi:hypothetical protein
MVFGSRQMLTKVPGFRLPFLGKELVPCQTSNVSFCMSKLGQINRVKHAFNSTLLTTIIHICLFLASYSTAPLFGQLPLLEI